MLLFTIYNSNALEKCSETGADYKYFCTKAEKYNKYVAPMYPDLTTVYLEIIIRKILHIDEENHFMELVAYSNLKWMEPRLCSFTKMFDVKISLKNASKSRVFKV